MLCYFMREGQMVSVEAIPELPDDKTMSRACEIFVDKQKAGAEYDGFEVRDQGRVVFRFPAAKAVKAQGIAYTPRSSVMNPRLIEAIYLASCVLAAVWIAFHIGAITLKGSRIAINHGVNVAFVGTALIWFAGRALRYIWGRQVADT
jgi:hypothetical protein